MPDPTPKNAAARVVSAIREPVTIAVAAERTGRTRKVIEHLVNDGKVQAKACLLDGRRTLLLELWEVEAALDRRRPYRRVVTSHPAIGVG